MTGEPNHPMELAGRPSGRSTCGLADCPEIETFDGRWWVAHTKARNEKALAADLEYLGVSYFLPLARVRRKKGPRRTEVRIPLFPGYLFLCGTEDDRYAAMTTHRVARLIPVPDQQGLRRDLTQIQQTLASGVPVDVYPGVRPGRRCRVARGSLAGVEGVVVRRRGVCRVYVTVDMLGQSAEVELDAGDLDIAG